MKPISELSRRDFLAASGAAVAASGIGGQLASAASTSPTDSKLAIDGGPKAVQEKLKPAKRWGEPERAQLNAAIEQNTMFYWQGPQTKLFTERFREVCPVKYVMMRVPNAKTPCLARGFLFRLPTSRNTAGRCETNPQPVRPMFGDDWPLAQLQARVRNLNRS